METVARTVLNLLPHTPLSATGINFQFIEEHPPEALLGLFRYADDARLADMGLRATKRSTLRSLEHDGSLLNFTMAHDQTGAMFDFNFHHDVAEPNAARDYLLGRVVACRGISERVLTAYGLELEEEGAHA